MKWTLVGIIRQKEELGLDSVQTLPAGEQSLRASPVRSSLRGVKRVQRPTRYLPAMDWVTAELTAC